MDGQLMVQKGEEVFNDPQLQHIGYFKWLNYPGVGHEFIAQQAFVKLSKTPAEVRKPRPMMGEHNEYVYTRIVGLSDEEFVQLMADGCFE